MDDLRSASVQYDACRDVLLHEPEPTVRDGAAFLHARIALYEALVRDGWRADPLVSAQIEQDRWALRYGRVPLRLGATPDGEDGGDDDAGDGD